MRVDKISNETEMTAWTLRETTGVLAPFLCASQLQFWDPAVLHFLLHASYDVCSFIFHMHFMQYHWTSVGEYTRPFLLGTEALFRQLVPILKK